MEEISTSNFIRPVALGIISDPATIVLTYDCLSEGKRKRRKRKMPLRDFTDRSNVKRYAFNIRQRHHKYLSEVIDVTLEKMLRIIQEIQKGKTVAASVNLVQSEYTIDPEENLNALSPAQLEQRKSMMEETFRKNLLKPGDPGYVYDKEIEFDDIVASTSNDWDDERSIIGDDNRDCEISHKSTSENRDIKAQTTVSVQNDTTVGESSPDREVQNEDKKEDMGTSSNVEDASKELIPSESKEAVDNLLGTIKSPEKKASETRTNQHEDVNVSSDESGDPLIDIEVGDIEEEDEDFWQ